MRRWIIAPLLIALGQPALASRAASVWDQSNRLSCAVVSAEVYRFPGGSKICTPAQASFDHVRIDYGTSEVNLLAGGRHRQAWTVFGVNYRGAQAAAIQLLHVRRGTDMADLVLDRNGTLRMQFERADGTLVVEARCRPR